MRVLVACEFSGVVRDAFSRAGHDAMSVDILPSETPGEHHQGSVYDVLDAGWDLMIAHPPCTYLANSGVQYLHTREGRWDQMRAGACLFLDLLYGPVKRVAVENPIPHSYARALIGRPTQWIEPYEFGPLETKKTGLWLRNLPPLLATQDGRDATMRRDKRERMPGWWAGSRAGRGGHERSRTVPELAQAMADQWGEL